MSIGGDKMANETKDIIIAVLTYLNDSLDEERINFGRVNPETLGVSEPRYNRVLEMMLEENLITGLIAVPTMGQSYNGYKAINPKPTLRGIDYLDSNKTSSKAYAILKEIRDWVPGY